MTRSTPERRSSGSSGAKATPAADDPQSSPAPTYAPPPWAARSASKARAAARASGPDGLNRSEWWRRVVAILIDELIIGIVVGPISTIAGSTHAQALLLLALNTAVSFPYFGVMNGTRRGQTIGKIALGIRVCDNSSGEAIGWRRGMLRFVLPWLGAALPLLTVILVAPAFALELLDGLWPLWDGRRQALHDKIVNSAVVDVTR
jgi:uncharacterized RDD family membrane protein YckC